MTLYSGMNNTSGKAITDIDHLRQSVRDILLTPQGSRIARREYGSLLSALIDDAEWTITTLTHTVSPDNGFTTSLELEVRIDDFEME
ncbi:hypothetical protein ACSD1U_003074 [Escherichia coli]